jgi:AraC family transcriptional regulator, exoenzyme S synthesis regulatory protein ExsA
MKQTLSISSRTHFSFRGKCILEKLTIEKSSRMKIDFPNEACYLYVRWGEVVVNGADLKASMSARDGVVLNCGYYIADFLNFSEHKSTEVLAIHLYPDILREIFRNELPTFLKGDPKSILPARTISDSMMEKFVESLLFYFDNAQIVTEDILALKVRELILLLVQSTHSGNIHNLFTALFTRKAAAVSEVVNANLYVNFSVSELAKLAGLSLTSFKEEFASLFGESPARYIRRKKIDRAKELLQVSDYSVSEIAFQTGFMDPSHFSKAFRATCGCSPARYRRRYNENDNNATNSMLA